MLAKPGETVTFRAAAERYQRDVLPTKARATQESNLRELRHLYEFFDVPPVALDEIEPVHIRKYLDWRGQTAKVRANREKALFSHIWNFARATGLTNKSNPCAGIRGFTETGRDVYVDDAVYKAVHDAGAIPLQDAMDLAYLTGQRPADVLKLKRTDIKDGALWIRQNKTRTKLRIAVEGELAALIERISSRKVMGLQLINMMDGTPMTKYQLRYALDQARAAAAGMHPTLAAEIRQLQFRDLRAKAATDKDELQGIAAAQEQLGHTSAAMTRHYVRNRKGKLVKPTK
jgi:integrase